MKFTLSISPSISRPAVKISWKLAYVKAILFETNYYKKSLKLESQHIMYNTNDIRLSLT